VNLSSIVSRIKQYVIEPDLLVPDSFIKRLNSIKEIIDPCLNWKGGFQTKDDLNLEYYQTCLLAFNPNIIAGIVQEIIIDAQTRPINEIYRLSHEINKNYLIYREDEFIAIKKIWQNISNVANLKDQQKYIESNLFKVLINDLSATEQIESLITKQDKFYWKESFSFFKKLDPNWWDTKFRGIESVKDTKLYYFLWFISKYPRSIPQKFLYEIQKLHTHSDENIRELAFDISYHSEDKENSNHFMHSSWSYNKDKTHEENRWGSIVLVKKRKDLSFKEIKSKIVPYLLEYAIYQRGNKEKEIEELTKDLIINKKKEWVEYKFERKILIEFLKIKPELVKKWLSQVLQLSNASIDYNLQQYIELCGALLNNASEDGVKLFKYLKNMKNLTRITINSLEVLDIYLFEVQKNELIIDLWNMTIDRIWTDYETLDISLIIKKTNNQDWFNAKIRSYLASDILLEKAKGINLIGFSDDDKVADYLKNFDNKFSNSWVGNVITTAKTRYQKNMWAKEWFKRFIESNDEIEAWAAFNLFLECVDRRFLLWKESQMDKLQDIPFFRKREVHLKLNWDAINKKMEENEKALKESFLGIIINKEIKPWNLNS